MQRPNDDELHAYGIAAEDEGPHPWLRDEPDWNESWFHDWTSDDGREAGHCRLGWLPNQGRIWLWWVLRRGDNWYLIDEPRIPAAGFDPERCELRAPGLVLQRPVHSALRRSSLHLRATVRCVAGPRLGQIASATAELDFDAMGPAHSVGEDVLGKEGDRVVTRNRYEQPVSATGSVSIGGDVVEVDGRGERGFSSMS